ncbi:MAG: SDR family oxidoreductase [Planctomycetes bacterium]|nr:SDR family oxidoreductase [Planctomycetota bacterium]
MSEYLLLTGSTGLLGRYLIRDLLLGGHRLAVLARPSRRESAADRIEAIMQMWEAELGRLLPRPICLEGDICEEGLGLHASSRKWVADHCSKMLHSAASLAFHADDSGEPYRSNVGGTKNMLALCRETGIRDLHYVSTAYVCGLRGDAAREDELDVGQEFRNDYERTKLEAETLVRQADFLEQLTVYRPTVISGDSKTGYTNTYHGLYLYLRLMAILVPQQGLDADGRRYTPIRLPMTGDERRNVVPIDWVSEVITHLFQTPEAHGHTFNLAPEKCLTPRQIIDAGYKFFDSTGVQYVGDQVVDPGTFNRFESEFLSSIGMYDNYKATDPTFDCTNLKKFAGHFPCPVIDESMLHQYIRFGQEDRWGKRKAPKTHVDISMGEYLEAVSGGLFEDAMNRTTRITADAAPDELRVALDVSGAGGGQWSLDFQGKMLLRVEPGLPNTFDAQLCLTIADVRRILDESKDVAVNTVVQNRQTFGASRDDLPRAVASIFTNSNVKSVA